MLTPRPRSWLTGRVLGSLLTWTAQAEEWSGVRVCVRVQVPERRADRESASELGTLSVLGNELWAERSR